MSETPQRAHLLATKLAALVREHDDAPTVPPVIGEFGLGAALMSGDEAWVFVDRDVERGLGAAVAWALRRSAVRLNVVADRATGGLARRAEAFQFPISVWHAHERSLLPAIVEPLAAPLPLDPAHDAFRSVIEAGGAVATVEHGVLVGEVEGLEVCRVVVDAETGEPRLEVGIGAHDRDAFQLLHGTRPDAAALADVVAIVAAQRRPGAEGHPLNRLGAERALRSRLMAEPHLIGASRVVSAEPPIARANLKDAVPCVALAWGVSSDSPAGAGHGEGHGDEHGDEQPVVVVCSVGVDLDVVPFATDARLSTGLARGMIVMPSRDVLPVQRTIVAALADPIEIVAVDLIVGDIGTGGIPAPNTP